jgi:hypothetical protein
MAEPIFPIMWTISASVVARCDEERLGEPAIASKERFFDALGNQNYWSPRKSGVNFDLSYSLEPLHAFREYLSIVSNTDARPTAAALAPTEGL